LQDTAIVALSFTNSSKKSYWFKDGVDDLKHKPLKCFLNFIFIKFPYTINLYLRNFYFSKPSIFYQEAFANMFSSFVKKSFIEDCL
jgi:hypothetical protein